MENNESKPRNFIQEIIDKDLETKKYDYVYIGVGAAKAYRLDVPGADSKGVYDQLEFLSEIRQGRSVETGNHIVVIGGGNSAMDASRAAKRMAGKHGKVTILYRRSIKEMPADLEEIDSVIQEGIEIQDLVGPQRVISENGRVKGIRCHRMYLVHPDAGGRPRPAVIEGSEFVINADTIVTAIGQQVVLPFWQDREFIVNPETYETNLEKVYAGGDAIRGASTLIKAIADGQKAALSIMAAAAVSGKALAANKVYETDIDFVERKMATRIWGPDLIETDLSKRDNFELVTQTMSRETAVEEASRCLSCDTLCNICTTVCPNRANISYTVAPFKARTYKAICKNGKVLIKNNGIFTVSQAHQVINIGDFCNECGNCTTFCPTSGSPYIEKPKFYLSMANFKKELSGYFMDGPSIFKRGGGKQVSLTENKKTYAYESKMITASLDKESFKVLAAEFNSLQDGEVDLTDAAELGFLYRSLKDLFCN